MMLASTLDNIGILDAAIVAVLGYAVVFFGLILLMGVIIIMGKAFMERTQRLPPRPPLPRRSWLLFPLPLPQLSNPPLLPALPVS